MLANKFILPNDKVYMCGHSLGPSLKTNSDALFRTLKDFNLHGANNWSESGWIDLPYVLGAKIAKLINAKDYEVIVCDSTVINLFKILKAAIKLQKGRNMILTTDDNFPADLYIAQGVCPKISYVKIDEIYENINEEVAVLMLTHVNYKNSSVLDMKKINEHAHNYGVLTVWDLSHSIGIIPIDLQNSGTDFAVGCTYKYLSGGPGSPAFIYANIKHHDLMESPIQGWLGHNHPFDFEEEYSSSGMRKFMGGTPSIFGMKLLENALEIFTPSLIERAYSALNEYGNILITKLKNFDIEVCMPKNRGGHVALMHKHGYGVSKALIDKGFICDYRPTGLVRICINPLYISLNDIEICIEKIMDIITNYLYLKPKYKQIKRVLS